ncbi:hypothetical protein, partial [Bacteriovorax sp. DB6_IX]|uniref:hypothetical protein n=1 Tax=Bacteriovorax sp. DB6_IX TaxID=1353530 RepID=UPI00038A3BB1
MKKLIIASLLFTQFSQFAQAQSQDLPVQNDFVDFNNIKKILKKDGLEKTVQKKKVTYAKQKKQKKDKTKQLYNLPAEKDFWNIMAQYWLVKNQVILKWDFHKPDYGLNEYFRSFLKDMGEYGVKYKILYVNSSNVTHFGLPLGKD